MAIKHSKVLTTADTGEVEKVGPADWNDDHSSPTHAETTGQTTDDHHAKSHAHSGADGSGTVAHSATTGRTANDHHNQSHAISGADHSGTLPHASTSGQTADDHHAKSHAHSGADGSGTVAHSATTGRTSDDHHNKSHAHSGADGSGTVAHADTTGRTANDHHNQLHQAAHNLTGADELEVEDLATDITDTSLFLRPDGSGGLVFADPALPAGSTGGQRVRVAGGSNNAITYTAPGSGAFAVRITNAFNIDLTSYPFTQYRILISGNSNTAGQTIAVQLATVATPGTPIHTGGNDIAAITSTGALWDSGWKSRDDGATGLKEYAIAMKGSNATVSLVASYIEVMLK